MVAPAKTAKISNLFPMLFWSSEDDAVQFLSRRKNAIEKPVESIKNTCIINKDPSWVQTQG